MYRVFGQETQDKLKAKSVTEAISALKDSLDRGRHWLLIQEPTFCSVLHKTHSVITGNALKCIIFPPHFLLSAWACSSICQTDLQSCWRSHCLSIALSKMQPCRPHGSLGVHVLKAMKDNHLKVSKSYKAYSHSGALHSAVVIWVLLVHLNKQDDAIIISVNKHDQLVRRDMGSSK